MQAWPSSSTTSARAPGATGRARTHPGEPFFVAGGGGAEDDGSVIFTAIDGERRHSIFVVLDARTMQEASVTDLPVHIPFTAHGQFLPDKQAIETIIV
mmetsp:Transcript_1766/g.5184  ORF Transcript_1766/g.5184 Transcript_1766/m.5184 type:complete len:98 (+) Transcript_1766:602-895(+)